MAKYVLWTIDDLARIAEERRKIEFDFIICFCGPRGNSKSSAGYKLGLKLKFNPEEDLIYDRDELIKALEGWDRTIDADEIINSAYKREFYNMDQIELVKLVNMYRDHRHVLVFCIPSFWDLDKPLRDLVKIRVDLIRRGVGVVHRALPLSYSNDPWDVKVNQVIERQWNRRGQIKPKYWQLTTFIGFLKFNKLDPRQEEKYKRIKNQKRLDLRQKKEDLKKPIDKGPSEDDKRKETYQRVIKLIREKKVSKEDLIHMAYMNGLKYYSFIDGLNRLMRDEGTTDTVAKLLEKPKLRLTDKTDKNINNSTDEGKDELGYPQAQPSSN